MTTAVHSANQSNSQRKSDKIWPLPKRGADGHYFPLSDLLGQPITEEYRPSLQQKSLSSYASVQHVKNARLMVQCKEYQMWHLIFSKHKLNTCKQQ